MFIATMPLVSCSIGGYFFFRMRAVPVHALSAKFEQKKEKVNAKLSNKCACKYKKIKIKRIHKFIEFGALVPH